MGSYLRLKEEFGPAVNGAWGAIFGWPVSILGSREVACRWAGHLPYWQGFRVQTERGMGCV